MSTDSDFSPLPPDPSFRSRKTVETFQEQTGKIVSVGPAGFGIELADSGQVYSPVNLPAALQQEGLPVTFSGDLKETGPAELWAGEPLVLTAIAQNKR